MVVADGATTLVFAFGLVNVDPLHLTTLAEYRRYTGGFGALPGSLRAWPVSVGVFLGGVASAIGGVLGVEDQRVTGGLLALAGVSHLSVATGLSRTLGRWAVPVGPVVLVAVAWWLYWPAIRAGSTTE